MSFPTVSLLTVIALQVERVCFNGLPEKCKRQNGRPVIGDQILEPFMGGPAAAAALP
jgi:hypothetical protein